MQEKKFNYEIRDLQLNSLGLLRCIDKVCQEHGLTYYIAFGTLLGAVRHKGFIPWDDDMDIALSRKDYDILMQHADEWIPKPFYIVNHENTAHYPKYFAKIEDTSTTLVENFHLGYAGGLYMDIFPFDEVPNSKFLRAVHFYKFNLLRRLLYLVYRNPYKHGHGPSSWGPLLAQKLFSKKWLHQKIQKVIREYEGKKNCDFLMSHDDGLKVVPKENFGTPKRMEFEGVSANVPTEPHVFLSAIYGDDYMQLPPVEKRFSHYHDYCDFNSSYKDIDFENLKKQYICE